MSFPHYKEIEEPLLAFIYLNGGNSKSIRSDEAYTPLADYFSLNEDERIKTRDEVFTDGKTNEKAWNNRVQWARRQLKKNGLLNPDSYHGIWELSENGINEAQRIIGKYVLFNPSSLDKPKTNDISDVDIPSRIETTIYRILRDTQLSRKLKLLHRDKCQICEKTIVLLDRETYSEAHHIMPLGKPHNGHDIEGNIIVLCPNHHVQCDYGAISIDIDQIINLPGHKILTNYIDYHNEYIHKKV